jgi:sec-independent protein translocase protein TatA
MSPILAFFESPPQLILVAFIALLLFGKRLPELMRSLGKGITEFKKGMNGIEEEMNRGISGNSNSNSYLPPPSYHDSVRPLPAEERPEITAPKFQPPTAAPTPPATHVS